MTGAAGRGYGRARVNGMAPRELSILLVLAFAAPAAATSGTAPCWKHAGGFAYRDRVATPDGLVDVRLGAAPRTRLSVQGEGPNLRFPAGRPSGASTVPLARSGGGPCWTSDFLPPAP